MTTTAPALPPIIKTGMAPGLRHGGATITRHRECWSSVTADGVWRFDRLDGEPRTPWAITHVPSGTELDWATSLRRCRVYVANGWAQAALERIQDHERGGHEAGREPMCGRC